ncbi:MAG: hypothetical protein ACRCZ2_13430 [Fusobacteriaceae bacterium]
MIPIQNQIKQQKEPNLTRQKKIEIYSQAKDELIKTLRDETEVFRVVESKNCCETNYEDGYSEVVNSSECKKIISSDYILLEKFEDNNIKIINNGVQTVSVKNTPESVVKLFISQDKNNPILSSDINENNLFGKFNLIKSVKVNGNVITSNNGEIDLGSILTSITNVYSSNGTIVSQASGQERVISVKPIRVNNKDVLPTKGNQSLIENGVLLNLVDSDSIKIIDTQKDNLSSNPLKSDVKFEVKNVIKSINNLMPDEDGNLTINGIGSQTFYTGDKKLTDQECLDISANGYDLSNTPTSGNTIGNNINLSSGYVLRLFVNGILLYMNEYTIINSKIKISKQNNKESTLSWWIQKI